jgi:hypothetical protein
MERTAADHRAILLGHPELLDVLVERDEWLGQQYCTGVTIDQVFDLANVSHPGPTYSDLDGSSHLDKPTRTDLPADAQHGQIP